MKTDLHPAQAALEKHKLSPQQLHVWKLQQLQVSDPFCVQCRVCVDGPMDASARRTAIEQVARRHDILRASFQILHGEDSPSQLIDESKLEICEHDLTHLPETEQADLSDVDQDVGVGPIDGQEAMDDDTEFRHTPISPNANR